MANTAPFASAMEGLIQQSQAPEAAYYYHGDHLGGAAWITDGTGQPVQHLQYHPFGEPYVNQRATGSTYNERYTFTGKERDAETGYSDHGARYLDHALLTAWLSPDPLTDKYPNISPYAYCAWNPVKIIDPDGADGRVVVNKNAAGNTSITISTTVYLTSEVYRKKDLAILVKNAQFEAKKILKSKVIDNHEVSFDIQYKVYQGEELLEGDNILFVNPNNSNISGVRGKEETIGGIVVGGIAGNTGEINSDITSLLGGGKGKGIVHETLHFLGLSDRYSGNHSFNGFNNDIMGFNAKNATEFDNSHYRSYIDKYRNADMSGKQYLLLRERIDVLETERLKRNDSFE